MSVSVPPAGTEAIRCPICRRYLGTIDVDSRYMRFPPCECGWQWIGEAVGKRARQTIETPAGRLEVKASR